MRRLTGDSFSINSLHPIVTDHRSWAMAFFFWFYLFMASDIAVIDTQLACRFHHSIKPSSLSLSLSFNGAVTVGIERFFLRWKMVRMGSVGTDADYFGVDREKKNSKKKNETKTTSTDSAVRPVDCVINMAPRKWAHYVFFLMCPYIIDRGTDDYTFQWSQLDRTTPPQPHPPTAHPGRKIFIFVCTKNRERQRRTARHATITSDDRVFFFCRPTSFPSQPKRVAKATKKNSVTWTKSKQKWCSYRVSTRDQYIDSCWLTMESGIWCRKETSSGAAKTQ